MRVVVNLVILAVVMSAVSDSAEIREDINDKHDDLIDMIMIIIGG